MHRPADPRALHGEIENFRLLKEIFYDSREDMYLIIGLVGERWDYETRDLNRIKF